MPASCSSEPMPLSFLQRGLMGSSALLLWIYRLGMSVVPALRRFALSGSLTCLGFGSSQPAGSSVDHTPSGGIQPGHRPRVANVSSAHHAVLHTFPACRIVAAGQQGVLWTTDWENTHRYGLEALAAWVSAAVPAPQPAQHAELCMQDCGSPPAGSLADH